MNDFYVLDTNILLRFLVKDDLEMVDRTKNLLHSEKSFYLYDVVISETIWVLTKFYKFDRKEVAEALMNIVGQGNVFCDKERVTNALELWLVNKKLSYVDAYILVSSFIDEKKAVYTFDKGILATKFNDVKVLEP